MIARIVSVTGSAEAITQGLELVKEQILPWRRDAAGFRGFIALVDLQRGRGQTITFWQDEESLRANEEAGAGFRRLLEDGTDGRLESVEFYEVAGVELAL